MVLPMATRVTSKGQVTIPKRVRDLLGIRPGTPVDFDLLPDGQVAIRPARGGGRKAGAAASRFARVRGAATVRMRTDEILALTRGTRRGGP